MGGLEGLQGPRSPTPAQRVPWRCAESPPAAHRAHLQALLSQRPPRPGPCRPRPAPRRRPPWRRPVVQGRLPTERLGVGGQGAYQVLQSTLILSPGEYRSLLCTHGHASSTTQPPRPSSISPSGHTQPLLHSIWYWWAVGERVRGSGAGPRVAGPSSVAADTPLALPPHPLTLDASPWSSLRSPAPGLTTGLGDGGEQPARGPYTGPCALSGLGGDPQVVTSPEERGGPAKRMCPEDLGPRTAGPAVREPACTPVHSAPTQHARSRQPASGS